jgi:L-2-hydroxyglutarate oxidase LhgO
MAGTFSQPIQAPEDEMRVLDSISRQVAEAQTLWVYGQREQVAQKLSALAETVRSGGEAIRQSAGSSQRQQQQFGQPQYPQQNQ